MLPAHREFGGFHVAELATEALAAGKVVALSVADWYGRKYSVRIIDVGNA